MTKQRKLYYGWIVTLLAGLTYFGSNGILSTSSGTIISQVLLVRGWDATSVSLTYTIKSFIGLLLPLAGILLLKIGARKCIFYTTTITAIFLAATGWVNTPTLFILVYGVAVSFSMMFNDQLACFSVVPHWWDKKRGQQGGFIQALGALGGVVFPPVITWLFLNFSWKTALIIMAVALMLITAIPQMIWMKDTPEEMGLTIEDGERNVKEKTAKTDKKRYEGYKSPIDWTIKDAMRTPQLWIVGLAWGSTVFGYCAVQYYGITHLMMNGFGDYIASIAISVMSAALLISSLIFSPMVDRMNPKTMLVIIGIIASVGCVLFNFAAASGSVVLMIISMIIAGAPNGPIICAVQNTLCSYFGVKNYAGIQPYCNMVITILGALSSTVCGQALTRTGSLSMAYYIAAIFGMAISIFIFIFLRPPKVSDKMKEKYAAMEAAEKSV